MKKITLMIGLLTLSVMTTQAKASQLDSEIAHGHASYVYTYSRVTNIISARNAETDALSEALSEILAKCMGENFELTNVKFFNGMNTGSININATVKYVCK